MTTLINNHSNILTHASYAAGIASGTALGYILSASGNLVNNALISTGCGVARAAFRAVFQEPLIEQIWDNNHERENGGNNAQNLLERENLRYKVKVFRLVDRASLGFSHGIALGTLATGTLGGGYIYSLRVCAEILPAYVAGAPLNAGL